MAQMHRDEADEQLVSIQSFSIAASLLYLIHREFLHSTAGEAVIMKTTLRSMAARSCANSVGPSRRSSLHTGVRAAIVCSSSLISAFYLVPRAHADASPAATGEGGLTEIVAAAR
jgi:hypothetical protein